MALPVILGLLLLLGKTTASDEGSVTPTMDDPLDVYVRAWIGSMVAVFLSLLAVVVTVYTWLEEVFLRDYVKRGVVLDAIVVSTTFYGRATAQEDLLEYLARIEYRPTGLSYPTISSTKNQTLVQKNVKILIPVTDPVREETWPSTALDVPSAIDLGETASNASWCTSAAAASSLRDDRQHEKTKIRIMLLPEYPRSGIPCSQIERLSGWAYRLPTIGFVLVLTTFSTVGWFVSLFPLQRYYKMSVWTVIGLWVFLWLLEAVVVTGCWGHLLQDGLRDFYLEDGEIVNTTWGSESDDSTLSSRDDSYLRMA